MASYSGLREFAFVSYAHKDSDIVVEIISRLTARGARIWYDENLVPTDEYVEVIAEKIEKSSFFIAFISKNSLASKFCRDEIRFAYETGKPMMVVHLDDEEPSAGIKMMTGGVQAIMKTAQIKDYVESIYAHLHKNVINDAGTIIKSTEEHTFYYSEKTDYECSFTVSRSKRGGTERETLVRASFPQCSEILGYQIITRHNRPASLTMQITVRWDFTYTRSGRDDEYFEETYEYVFYNLDAPSCQYTKRVVEKYDINEGIITTYDYVEGVATDTDRSGKILRIHGTDRLGNYWNVKSGDN